jgi:hypothetical protein
MPEAELQMDDVTASEFVVEALDRLFAEEFDLFPDGGERAIAAQYARHLERALHQRPGLLQGRWSVDCEYNRLGADPKALPRLEGMLEVVTQAFGWPAVTLTGRVMPDVVVHQRRSGIGVGNWIACELKHVTTDKLGIAADLVKLAGYRDHLGYEHAFLILVGDTREACVVHRASRSVDDIIRYVRQLDEAAAIRRWKRGHALAAHRQRSLQAAEGAQPARAVAESLSALNAMDTMGLWPAPRDAVSERAIQQVRHRWARVQHRAKQARPR